MENEPTSLYRHFRADGVLLYIGVSLSVLVRLRDHASGSHWSDDICRVDIERFESRTLAIIAETEAIQKEAPLYNVQNNKPKYPNRREVQTDDAIDAMVNDWRAGKPLAYAEAVREMICAAAIIKASSKAEAA